MHDDETRAMIAVGVFALTILLVAIVVTRFRLDYNDSLIMKLGVSSCFLVLAALSWSLCYMGFVSGVMMSINRGRNIENDLANDPTGFWVALAFAYFLGLVFLSAGAVMLVARRTR
jgi:hypothetical protein